MNRDEIIKRLEEYNFDKNEYILISSGSMVMHGLKENARDLDIAVSPKLYDELIKKYNPKCFEYTMEGKLVKYYSFDVFDFSVESYNIENRTFIDGIPVQNLNSLLEFKKGLFKSLNREKDKKDISLIENYLQNKNINVLVLAYLGDAVYELYVRKYLINKGICKVNDLQKEAIKYVSANAQSDFLEKMLNDGFLTDEEIIVVKRARNHKSHSSKSTDIVTYKRSTGLEALIGYLEINKNSSRIEEIMKYIVGDSNGEN